MTGKRRGCWWGEDDHWECPVCGGEQALSRDYCHNCFEGHRPVMDNRQRKKLQRILKVWNHRYGRNEETSKVGEAATDASHAAAGS